MLTQEQINQIYQARPDVQQYYANKKNWKKYGGTSQAVSHWYDVYSKGGGQSLLNPQQVYSATNLEQASTAPAPKPDDLMNIRSGIYNELGIPTMQTEQQNFYNQLLNYDTASEQGQQGILDQQKAMGVIRGEQATQQAQRDLGRSALARQLEAVNTRLQGAMTEAGDRFSIRSQEIGDVKNLMLQFPDSGISFGDTTEQMAEKIKKSNEKKTVIDMFTQTFGYFPEGMSMDTINSKLAKKYKSDKAYQSAKQALELQNAQSLIDQRIFSQNESLRKEAEKSGKEEQDRVSKEVDERSKFMDNIVQTYITKYNKERRQSKKDAIKNEARQKIEARYPGWGWVADKIG